MKNIEYFPNTLYYSTVLSSDCHDGRLLFTMRLVFHFRRKEL